MSGIFCPRSSGFTARLFGVQSRALRPPRYKGAGVNPVNTRKAPPAGGAFEYVAGYSQKSGSVKGHHLLSHCIAMAFRNAFFSLLEIDSRNARIFFAGRPPILVVSGRPAKKVLRFPLLTGLPPRAPFEKKKSVFHFLSENAGGAGEAVRPGAEPPHMAGLDFFSRCSYCSLEQYS